MIEDLGVFLVDFGVTAEFGARRAQVIFDSPDNNVLSNHVQSTAYAITFRTNELPGLGHGDWVKIQGVDYSVISVSRIDDGAFSTAELQTP